MNTKPIIVSAGAVQHAVTEMLKIQDINGIARILPDLTFGQAVQILRNEMAFEGNSEEGIRLVVVVDV